MKKIELLSPAGDFECLKSAVNNGADAIYLSGKNYGARKFANNFTLEEIASSIKYCHLYGVKVYITINTLVFDNEIDEFLEYVKTIYEYGTDAVIMQDIGLITKVHDMFPALEIHASTQAHNHNKEGIEFLKSLGVKRVVLARELSLKEINNINVDIEKEIFIHGALCVSYSGQCLFSHFLLNRSGNRGECAGLCRLPYKINKNDNLFKDKSYILSMKELNCINNIKEILDSDIDSLKIEGRMKSKEYVGYVTKIYRKLIDAYYNNLEAVITNEELDNLKVLYNREFTKGFINEENKYKIVNEKTPNHQGIEIGEVLDISKKIKIKLTKDLYQNDGIRLPNNEGMIVNFIYNQKDMLVNKGCAGEIIYLDNKVDLRTRGIVKKTLDSKLNTILQKTDDKKIPVSFKVKAKVGDNLEISIMDNENTISQKSIILEKANKNITSKEEIKEKLEKLGNTPFILKDIIYDADNDVFIPMKEINNLRRKLTDLLKVEREKVKKDIIIKSDNKESINMNITHDISFLVRNEEQLKYLLKQNVNIYTEDFILYNKYKKENVYFKTNRVITNHVDLAQEKILIGELGGLTYTKDNCVVSDIYLNVANYETLKLLAKSGVSKISLSLEINDDNLKTLFEKEKQNNCTFNKDLYIYGRPELMVMKYCPVGKANNKCLNCNNDKYSLISDKDEEYPLLNNNCLVKLLHKENIDLTDKIEYYRLLGITNFRIDLYDESDDEIKNILAKIGLHS